MAGISSPMNLTPATQKVVDFLVSHRGKMPQQTLAELTHVTPGAIAHYEKGRRPISEDMAAAIATALDLTEQEIVEFRFLRVAAELAEHDKKRAHLEAKLDAIAAAMDSDARAEPPSVRAAPRSRPRKRQAL